MTYSILFDSVNVNTQDTNATITVGENVQSGWNAHSKNNFGNGMLFGWNYTIHSRNYVMDSDTTDTIISDNEFDATNQGQVG
ncbi:hypothetical protein [Terrihalobacillus insolitus]|uniref:hypothetical protein n=1 Tax=Terrihalobacillus insolitus TaxID=2950438 RepID=UPI0023412E7E|nr:hypothetical protein [Terrihalobacillus insolitus]MDC3413712.1 hypothetical protein [Terrihalobacillus insolitus]